MDKRLGIGVIGCGAISEVHLSNLRARNDVELVLACDVIEERAKQRALQFGARGYVTDYKDLLSDPDIDAVLCLVPQGLHAEIVIEAAKARKHVFCEKPMAMSVAECRAMRKAVEEAGVVLQIGHVLRFSSDVAKLKEWIDADVIGRPVLFRDMWAPSPWGSPYPWVFDRKMGGGPLFENAHWIDLLNYLFGRPLRVYASLHYFKPDGGTAPDTILVVIEYEGGDKAVWSDTWSIPGYGWEHFYVRHHATRSHFDIVGPRGSIHFPAPDGSRRVFLYQNERGRDPVETYEWETDWGCRTDAYRAELTHFLDCVRRARTPLCSAEEGEWVIQVAEAAYLSHATGKVVELPLKYRT